MSMSNIASPRRTEPAPALPAVDAKGVATLLATFILTALLITFRPFSTATEAGASGDPVNQIGYGLLGAIALGGLLMLTDRRVLAAMISPWWLLLLALAAISVLTAADSEAALRSFSFTLVAILCVLGFLGLQRDLGTFSVALTFAATLVLALSYAGIVLMPETAIHGASGPEPEHAGLWRGVFSHKNIAGPVVACTGFVGLFWMRRGRPWLGAIILAASIVFVWNTGSKTAAGLIPITVLAVLLPRLMGLERATPYLVASALAIGFVATVGLALIGPVGRMAAELAPDLTYTGRLTIWEFAIDMIEQRPWFGYGHESFWGSAAVTRTDVHFDMAWDVRGTVHAHNGYLDIALNMGVPALVVAIIVFAVLPLRDYARTTRARANVLLADMFLMMLVYTLLNGLLESFFFRRADPVWIVFLLAVLGLRFTARLSVPWSTGRPD
jgi:O-antigen ligase